MADPNVCKVNHAPILNLVNNVSFIFLKVFCLKKDFLYLLSKVPGGHRRYQLKKHLIARRRITLRPVSYVEEIFAGRNFCVQKPRENAKINVENCSKCFHLRKLILA